MIRKTQFSPSMAWELEDLTSEIASATYCQIVNPQAMQKCPHPDRCWVSNEIYWDQFLLSTYQYLFPNDHRAFLCLAKTWNPYNIYNEKWKVLALWLERTPTGLCAYCCAALLAVCSVLKYMILFTVSKANRSTVMLLFVLKSDWSILVLKKKPWCFLYSAWWNCSLRKNVVWKRWIYMNWLLKRYIGEMLKYWGSKLASWANARTTQNTVTVR